MGVGAIISGFALLVGMIALWLASDTSRRLNSQGQAFVDAHVGRIRSDMTVLAKDIGELKRHTKAVQGKVVGMEERQDSNDEADLIKAEILSLRQRLSTIESALPPSLRQGRPQQSRVQ